MMIKHSKKYTRISSRKTSTKKRTNVTVHVNKKGKRFNQKKTTVTDTVKAKGRTVFVDKRGQN